MSFTCTRRQSPSSCSMLWARSLTLLAMASEKGMVIRVWSVPGMEKLYQIRCSTRKVWIYSITFNAVSTLLAASSAHDTVHIFKLSVQEKGGWGWERQELEPCGLAGQQGGAIGNVNQFRMLDVWTHWGRSISDSPGLEWGTGTGDCTRTSST